MTKFFQPAVPIKVKDTARRHPSGFSYKRKFVSVRRVNRHWRIREGWWRDEVAREYFQLETPRFTCMIYRDMRTNNWHLQRIYD